MEEDRHGMGQRKSYNEAVIITKVLAFMLGDGFIISIIF